MHYSLNTFLQARNLRSPSPTPVENVNNTFEQYYGDNFIRSSQAYGKELSKKRMREMDLLRREKWIREQQREIDRLRQQYQQYEQQQQQQQQQYAPQNQSYQPYQPTPTQTQYPQQETYPPTTTYPYRQFHQDNRYPPPPNNNNNTNPPTIITNIPTDTNFHAIPIPPDMNNNSTNPNNNNNSSINLPPTSGSDQYQG